MPHDVGKRVVGEETSTRVGNHAHECGREAAEEIAEAMSHSDFLGHRRSNSTNRVRRVVLHRRGMLVINFPTYTAQRRVLGRLARLEGEAYADDFERVGEKDRDHACEGAGHEAADGRLVVAAVDHVGANLLVSQEFYTRVGENA